MLKISANPSWEWQPKKTKGPFIRPSTTHRTSPISIRQTILPRSLDLTFALKYRR